MAIRARDPFVATPEISQATRATTFDVPFRPASEAMIASQAVNVELEPEETTTVSTPNHANTPNEAAIPDISTALGTDATLQPHEITTDVLFVDTETSAEGWEESHTAKNPRREMTTIRKNPPEPRTQNRKRETNPQRRVTKTTRPARNKRGWRRRPFYSGDESDAWSTTATVDGPISEFRMKAVGERVESSGEEGIGTTASKEKRERRHFLSLWCGLGRVLSRSRRFDVEGVGVLMGGEVVVTRLLIQLVYPGQPYSMEDKIYASSSAGQG